MLVFANLLRIPLVVSKEVIARVPILGDKTRKAWSTKVNSSLIAQNCSQIYLIK